MIIKNLVTSELYTIDLYEKWWHYILLGLSWFVPHKAYKINSLEISNSKKQSNKFGIGSGLVIGSGIIFGDLLSNIDLYRIPVDLHWIGNLLSYPLVVLTVFVIWKIVKKRSIAFKNYEKNDYILVKINFFSVNALIHCFWKLAISYFFVYFLSINFKYDITIIILLTPIILIISSLFFIGVGKDAIITSTDNSIYKILELSKIKKTV